jgi:hypothetical protein
MLLSSTRYAFVVAADEVMFLKFDLVEKVSYNTPDGREYIKLFVEPWIYYSPPIKFTDTLDPAEGTVSVKLAMLYLLHCSMQNDWQLKEDIGNSMKYSAKTKPGEKYVPVLSWLPKKK